MQDRARTIQVEQVAESRFKTQQLAVDRKTPAIDAVHGMNGVGDRLNDQRLFMQGDTQFFAAAEFLEVIANAPSLAEQAIGKGRYEDRAFIVEGKQSFQITAVNGEHPFLEEVFRFFHGVFFYQIVFDCKRRMTRQQDCS